MRRLFFTLLGTIYIVCCCGANLYEDSSLGRAGRAKPNKVERVTNGVEIDVLDGSIWISSPKGVTVRVYSILGNLVMELNVEQGLTAIPIKSKGIYLVNADNVIKRVVI